MHFTRCVLRARLDTISRRKDTSFSVNLFRELCQVVDVKVTSSAPFVPGMLRVRSIVLVHVPS